MMKQILHLILFLTLGLSLLSQPKPVKKVVDTVIKVKADVRQPDTISQNLEDTIYIEKNAIGQSPIKVIITKEESKPDYLKYILPILTLFLGIGLNKALDYLKDRKRIKKSGERWIAEIRCLEIPIKSQIASLQTFKKEIEKDKFEIPELEIFPMLKGEIFKSLDKADLVKYIEVFKEIKYDDAVLSSNRIHGYISILESHHEALKSQFEDFQNNTSAHTTTFSRNLQALMRAFGNYGVALEAELHQDPINQPRYQPIYQLFNQYILPFMTSGEYDVYALERDFFIPLIQILGHFRLDSKINEMTDAVSGCLAEIKGIKMEKGYLTENIKILISRYENDLGELSEIVKEIKK